MKPFEDQYAGEFFRLQGELDGTAGKMYEEWDFDFRALISEIGVQVGIAAREKGLYLALSVEPDTPRYLRGNPVLIRDVILNLVNYSLESMKEGGLTIKVCSMPMGGGNKNRLEVIISDTGPGMQAEELDEIFRPSCSSKILKRSCGKIISGPLVSKRLALLMGGRVSARSVFGWGTRYSVNFILPEVSSPADRFKDNWGRIVKTMSPGERMVGAAYVDNIPVDLSGMDILNSLKTYEGVLSVMLLFDVHTGLSQNTAWLMLQQPAETVELLNGVDICGWCTCVRLMGYWYPESSVKTMESDRCRLRKA